MASAGAKRRRCSLLRLVPAGKATKRSATPRYSPLPPSVPQRAAVVESVVAPVLVALAVERGRDGGRVQLLCRVLLRQSTSLGYMMR